MDLPFPGRTSGNILLCRPFRTLPATSELVRRAASQWGVRVRPPSSRRWEAALSWGTEPNPAVSPPAVPATRNRRRDNFPAEMSANRKTKQIQMKSTVSDVLLINMLTKSKH